MRRLQVAKPFFRDEPPGKLAKSRLNPIRYAHCRMHLFGPEQVILHLHPVIRRCRDRDGVFRDKKIMVNPRHHPIRCGRAYRRANPVQFVPQPRIGSPFNNGAVATASRFDRENEAPSKPESGGYRKSLAGLVRAAMVLAW